MDKRTASHIRDLVDDYRSEMVDLVKILARLESPSTVPEAQEAVISVLEQNLSSIGYRSIRVPGKKTGGFLYASPDERDRSRPVQLLIGHCDTVWPLETLERMPVSADQEIIRGPGVYDMKGGLTQMIYALKVLYQLNREIPVVPIVLINSDEEIGSRESTNAIRRIARLSDRAFVMEPSFGESGKLKTTRKGVGRFSVKVKGKSAHAGLNPAAGSNAIVALSHIIQALFKLNDPERGISVNVGMVEGGTRPNVVAADSSAVVDVRVPTQKDAIFITEKIHDLKHSQPQVAITIEGFIGRQPMEATERNRKLWQNARQAGDLLRVQLEEACAGGASDGNTTSLYTATLDGLGATGDGAHAVHEFMYIDRMIERTTLLTLLLLMDPVKC